MEIKKRLAPQGYVNFQLLEIHGLNIIISNLTKELITTIVTASKGWKAATVSRQASHQLVPNLYQQYFARSYKLLLLFS